MDLMNDNIICLWQCTTIKNHSATYRLELAKSAKSTMNRSNDKPNDTDQLDDGEVESNQSIVARCRQFGHKNVTKR